MEETDELELQDLSEAAKYYIPNGRAEEFIKMVGSGDNFISMFLAANGVGKSASGANIVTNIVFGKQNQYFDFKLFNDWPYLKRGRIIADPTTIKEKIVPELKKWFPVNRYAVKFPDATYETSKEGKVYEAKILTNTGWEIDLMTTEQDAKEFESVDLGFVWFDEPPPQSIFKATVSRGRMGMIMFFTLTPLFHSAWLKDELVDKAAEKSVDYVQAEIEDNCKIHGVRGILEHENIIRMVAAYDEDEKEARAFGKFGHLIGKVHKAFSRKIHVIKPFRIDVKKFTCYLALDPHPRTPDHTLWMAIDRRGQKYIVNELVSRGLVRELAYQIKDIEQKNGYRVERRLIDPAAFVDDQHNEKPSVGSQLFNLDLHFIKGSKDLQAGIKRTNDALDYEMKGGEFVRAPEIYIFDTCVTTIKQIEEYTWSNYTGRGADERQAKGKPKDINDHSVENLHRLLLAEFSFIPYSRPDAHIGAVDDMSELDPYS